MHRQLAEDGLVTQHQDLPRHHLGTLMGLQPTGRSVNFDVIDVCRVRNRQITDHWGVTPLPKVAAPGEPPTSSAEPSIRPRPHIDSRLRPIRAGVAGADHGRIRRPGQPAPATGSASSQNRPGWAEGTRVTHEERAQGSLAEVHCHQSRVAVAVGWAKMWVRWVVAAVTSALVVGCGGEPQTVTVPKVATPYAGLQDREIRALAPEQVDDLLAGRGAGFALAAELNHYPGPAHVLELADQIELSADQERVVRDIEAAMRGEARRLGAELVELERELDRAFRSGRVDEGTMTALVTDVATVEGALRATHLRAHLQTRDVLTTDQLERYDRVRGYTDDDDHAHSEDHSGR